MPLAEAGFLSEGGRPDPELLVAWGPTTPAVVAHFPAGEDTPKQAETVSALIDTGAAESCIDVGLAERLGLPVVDKCMVSGVGGAARHPVYAAKIEIPNLSGQYQRGRFSGVRLADGGQRHLVLLGRTFLRNVIMVYDGIRGHATLAAPHIPLK